MFNLFYVLFCITAFFVILAVMLVSAAQRQRNAITKRISSLVVRSSEDETQTRAAERVARRVSLIASAIRARIGAEANVSVEERFIAAGIRLPKVSDVYFVSRILIPLILGGAAWLLSGMFLLGVAGAIAGYLVPGFYLDHLVKRYRIRLKRALPDVVDLLVVCVDAGLGIEQAMLRAARELSIAYPEVCYEFLETNRQRQAGLTREQAWQNLVSRSKLDEFETMVAMLNQADQLGTPLAVGLRTFADTLRTQRRITAEETAAKASVFILIPLVLFIFPTVYVVIMGPALLTLMNGLSHGLVPK